MANNPKHQWAWDDPWFDAYGDEYGSDEYCTECFLVRDPSIPEQCEPPCVTGDDRFKPRISKRT